MHKVRTSFDEYNNPIKTEKFEKIEYGVEFGSIGSKGLRFSKWALRETESNDTESIDDNNN
jgi:hypothetical protein